MLSYDGSTIQQELGQSERLLWSGRPKQGILFRTPDLFLIPFSLLWAGFVIIVGLSTISGGAPFFFTLWSLVFFLVGLYVTIGRFFVDVYIRSKTHYGLTNERLIIVTDVFSHHVKSVSLRTTSDISMTQKANGDGTIIFGSAPPFTQMYRGMPWPGMTQYTLPQFEMISDVKHVYALIRDVQREH